MGKEECDLGQGQVCAWWWGGSHRAQIYPGVPTGSKRGRAVAKVKLGTGRGGLYAEDEADDGQEHVGSTGAPLPGAVVIDLVSDEEEDRARAGTSSF